MCCEQDETKFSITTFLRGKEKMMAGVEVIARKRTIEGLSVLWIKNISVQI